MEYFSSTLDGYNYVYDIINNHFIYDDEVQTPKNNYKLYGLVLRHLSTTQKSIQFSHCVVEYVTENIKDDVFNKWLKNNKSMVMLDAKSTEDIREIISKLKQCGYKYATFVEPDLDNICTCVCFIMDTSDIDDKYTTLIYDLLKGEIKFSEENNLKKLVKNKRLSR